MWLNITWNFVIFMPRYDGGSSSVVTPFCHFGISYFKKHSYSSERETTENNKTIEKAITNGYSIEYYVVYIVYWMVYTD